MNKIKKFYSALILGSSFLPLVAGAQDIDTILEKIETSMSFIIGTLFVLATLVFLWGVVMFIIKSGDDAERKKAKGIMTWGIIGLAVMAAAWGITTILVSYFGVPAQPPGFRPYPQAQ